MQEKEKNIKKVKAAEEDQVSRKLLAWLNTCLLIPDEIDLIRFEYLPAEAPAMALSTIQGAYIVKEYITGDYLAEYQFKLIYRIPSPGSSVDKRLKADEALNAIGDWTDGGAGLDIGEDKRVMRLEATTRSSLFGVYENGDEDHQILFKLNYEVNT